MAELTTATATAPQQTQEWVGRRVRHEDFGTGTIVRTRGSDLFIDFPGHGETWLEHEDLGRWIQWAETAA